MSFGWSASDVIAALQLLNQIRTALRDVGGASEQYRNEVAFLDSLTTTVGLLDTLQPFPLDRALALNLQQHCDLVRGPLNDFLADIKRRFSARLDPKTPWWDVSSAPKKIRWASSTSTKVKELRANVSGSLHAVQICLIHQSLCVSESCWYWLSNTATISPWGQSLDATIISVYLLTHSQSTHAQITI